MTPNETPTNGEARDFFDLARHSHKLSDLLQSANIIDGTDRPELLGWDGAIEHTAGGIRRRFRSQTGRLLSVDVDPTTVVDPTNFSAACIGELQKVVGGIRDGSTLLDVGTGSGILSLAALDANPTLSVHAIDVMPAAVMCAKRNVLRAFPTAALRVERADLLTNELPMADVVVANLPDWPLSAYAEGARKYGLVDGQALYEAILAQSTTLVRPGGALVMAFSSLQDLPGAIDELNEHGFEVSIAQVVRNRGTRLAEQASRAKVEFIMQAILERRSAGKAAFDVEWANTGLPSALTGSIATVVARRRDSNAE